MSGGVSLQTSVTFERFELECWDWSQIKDFEGDYIRFKKTRPYTQAEVAGGWAGAVKRRKKAKCDRRTDGQTNRPTDRVG